MTAATHKICLIITDKLIHLKKVIMQRWRLMQFILMQLNAIYRDLYLTFNPS